MLIVDDKKNCYYIFIVLTSLLVSDIFEDIFLGAPSGMIEV